MRFITNVPYELRNKEKFKENKENKENKEKQIPEHEWRISWKVINGGRCELFPKINKRAPSYFEPKNMNILCY